MADPAVIGAGVGARLVDIEAVLARQESFVFDASESSTSDEVDDDMVAVAEDLVLRALHVAAEPVNHRLLARLGEGDISLASLGRLLDLPRIATSERVNDLLQSGLVGRSVERDLIGLTPAGQQLVDLVSEATAAAAEHATKARR